MVAFGEDTMIKPRRTSVFQHSKTDRLRRKTDSVMDGDPQAYRVKILEGLRIDMFHYSWLCKKMDLSYRNSLQLSSHDLNM
jgi:hypothetical protein